MNYFTMEAYEVWESVALHCKTKPLLESQSSSASIISHHHPLHNFYNKLTKLRYQAAAQSLNVPVTLSNLSSQLKLQ